jgi:Zn-dependent M28 family amino/carboxypeptidase
MFDHAQKSLKQALADAAANKPQAFPLPLTVSITQHSQWRELTSPNVAAVLPGADPKLKDQYLVFTAHADHLGIGDPVDGDTIYNGAMDNASGTAAMLAIAHALSVMPSRPRRSILFIAVTGEEEGDLGSDYFAQNPRYPFPDRSQREYRWVVLLTILGMSCRGGTPRLPALWRTRRCDSRSARSRPERHFHPQ